MAKNAVFMQKISKKVQKMPKKAGSNLQNILNLMTINLKRTKIDKVCLNCQIIISR